MATTARAICILAETVVPIDTGFVVVGVATSAIRLIGGRGPVNLFAVTHVAACTGKVARMIQWFVAQGHVRKRIWRPEGARMARIAFLWRDEMS